jgi:hypothetical protein
MQNWEHRDSELTGQLGGGTVQNWHNWGVQRCKSGRQIGCKSGRQIGRRKDAELGDATILSGKLDDGRV